MAKFNVATGDSFYNESACRALVKALARTESNKVVCVDGKWGVGKSYFCKKFAEFSQGEMHVVIMDAYASDYNDDPLVALIGVIAEALDDEEARSSFLGKVVPYLPGLISGFAELSKELVSFPGSSYVISKAEEIVRGRIDNYLSRENSIEGVRAAVKELVGKCKNKKLVLLIDELDRCRPSYALELIEKVKHVFDVDGLHVVLSMNKEQLLSSISHAYGIMVSRESYLEKFLNYSITLQGENVVAGEYNVKPNVDYAYGRAANSMAELMEDDLAEDVAHATAVLISLHSGVNFRGVDRLVDVMVTVLLVSGLELVKETSRIDAAYIVAMSFLSIYHSEDLAVLGPDRLSSKASYRLMVSNSFSNPAATMLDYSKIPEAAKNINGEVFFGLWGCICNSQASNTAGIYKSQMDEVLDTYGGEALSLHFKKWLEAVRSLL